MGRWIERQVSVSWSCHNKLHSQGDPERGPLPYNNSKEWGDNVLLLGGPDRHLLCIFPWPSHPSIHAGGGTENFLSPSFYNDTTPVRLGHLQSGLIY